MGGHGGRWVRRQYGTGGVEAQSGPERRGESGPFGGQVSVTLWEDLHPVTAVITLAFALLALPALDETPWPDYRGPGRNGEAPGSCSPPLTWSEEENVVWKVPVEGRGWSSPVVGGGRIWFTTADPEGHRLSVQAHDLETGEKVLDRVLFEVEEPEPRHDLNSYASPSPALGNGSVVLHFGTYGTVCLDTETFEERWRRDDLNCDHIVGPGSSPVVLGGRVVLHLDGGDVQYIACLSLEDGNTIWRTDRSVDYGSLEPDLRKAYSTPVPIVRDGRTILVSTGAEASYGYALESGEELWRVRHKGFSMSARPVIVDGHALVNTGFNRPELWSIRLGGEGDVTETHIHWKAVRGLPTMSTPVVAGGRVYYVGDGGGILTCLDPATGEEVWRERVSGSFSASVLHARGHVFFFDREGKTTVIRPGDTYEHVATNELEDGCMASPAVVGDALILRTRTALYRIEEGR